MSAVMLGMPGLPPAAPRGVGNLRGEETFQAAARRDLANVQLRRNLGDATRIPGPANGARPRSRSP